MKDGICPKCGSTDVHTAKRGAHRSHLIIGMFGFNATHLQDYVCAYCGYTEQYVVEARARNSIRDNWERVDGQPNIKHKNDE